ncbi:pirin family protein [Bacillus alkalicellulosilyticus]|uniref:pirin family protein n=1 Tax=Alkalihalobacterium alkalicellulosilyticum TaxID=1912214 RepID=UPI0011168E26|nr:pirin family protein [Bacillus alkalicellulosilyticus]
MYERGIQRKWKPHKKKNSSSHSSALLLEPGHWSEYDPFLLLAEDWFERGTFGLHPHRGIETVTYVIDGKLEHYDNKAGSGEIIAGETQWMTAGKGVLHAEEPAEGVVVHSLQLWVNLPRDNKMVEPRYQNLKTNDIPTRQEDGVTIRVISGQSGEVTAATKNYVPITMLECSFEENKTIVEALPSEYNGFIYILEGSGSFGKDNTVGTQGEVLWLERAQGDKSTIKMTSKEELKLLVYVGLPLNEPVVARGPFVMNTEEEIKQAYQDFRDGKFAE